MLRKLPLVALLLFCTFLVACSGSNQAPIANFTVTSDNKNDTIYEYTSIVIVDLASTRDEIELQLDASGSINPKGDDLRYLWEFSDNTNREGIFVKHIFPPTTNQGNITTIQLTVTDRQGNSSRIRKDINIVQPLVPLLTHRAKYGTKAEYRKKGRQL
jgi:hypothetical protein